MTNLEKENLRRIAEELIWYGSKSENGKWEIYICVDFDYTLTCKGAWTTGKFIENPGCFDILKRWAKDYNCKYVLDTMRGGERLLEAVKWCNENGIEFVGLNRNPHQDKDGESSNKAWCAYSIDDHNLGCPLVYPEGDGRPYVDWNCVDKMMTEILDPLSELLVEMEEEVLTVKAEVEKNNA